MAHEWGRKVLPDLIDDRRHDFSPKRFGVGGELLVPELEELGIPESTAQPLPTFQLHQESVQIQRGCAVQTEQPEQAGE